ncbi:hypothetical protein L2725_22285 [Shewanella corallii]|uniref:Type II restriction endonuclease n=1 Tax=Shewanella corallii TaxID=560080 RepID=A0ABT0NDD4_9GAMM|nr:DUF2283 domain-containing protein [Shewanella corallii]MCL2916469.1 hypothetical protein [Shewanella corallii]
MAVKSIKFEASCVKTLSAVEAEPTRSNQHEFNGVSQLKSIFGEVRREDMKASFSERGSDEMHQSFLTWYDAREKHPTRSEFRLYFKSNAVMDVAKEGDNIVIGFDKNGNIHCELIPQGSNSHRRTNGWEPG